MDPYITSRRYYLNSGPDGSVRIVYELDTYKNYPRGRRYQDIVDLDGPHMLQLDFDTDPNGYGYW